jgi:hypothetical protein
MDPPFASRFPFEVFYGVSDVDISSLDTGLSQGFVEQFARGTYERASLDVLLVTGLFTD